MIGTKDLRLTYGGEEKELMGYANTDGNMAEDQHAMSGYAFVVNSRAVSWIMKIQGIVSLLMTESEYIAERSAVAALIDQSGVWPVPIWYSHHAFLQ